MANWHTRAKVISRQVKGRDGKPVPGRHNSLVAALAYRGGLTLTDERTKERYDFRRKAKGVPFSIILAPAGAPDWMRDPGTLANTIERREDEQNRHAAAQLVRELEQSLSVELSGEQGRMLALRFGGRLVDLGMIVQVSIHEPKPNKRGERNPHVHFLGMMRGLDAASPDGLGLKRRDWNDKALYETLLTDWERMTNEALEDAGSTARVDRRSFAERGIDKLPSVHWGRTATTLLRDGRQDYPARVLKAEGRTMDNRLRPAIRGLRERGETPQFGMGKSRWERQAFLAGQEADAAPDVADWRDYVTGRRERDIDREREIR